MELFLLIIILILCIFNSVSIFLIGGIVARSREDISELSSVITSVPAQRGYPSGRRYDPESQLEDIKAQL
jgi:hypothetical protein